MSMSNWRAWIQRPIAQIKVEGNAITLKYRIFMDVNIDTQSKLLLDMANICERSTTKFILMVL
jgi:hypothetical protein